jgi:hypothetical protein
MPEQINEKNMTERELLGAILRQLQTSTSTTTGGRGGVFGGLSTSYGQGAERVQNATMTILEKSGRLFDRTETLMKKNSSELFKGTKANREVLNAQQNLLERQIQHTIDSAKTQRTLTEVMPRIAQSAFKASFDDFKSDELKSVISGYITAEKLTAESILNMAETNKAVTEFGLYLHDLIGQNAKISEDEVRNVKEATAALSKLGINVSGLTETFEQLIS